MTGVNARLYRKQILSRAHSHHNFFKGGIARALAEAIDRLRADPTLGPRLGAEGRRRCRGPFDRRTMVDELEMAYRKVIAASPESPS